MYNQNQPVASEPTWWNRNWKWVVIVGSILFFLLICVGVIGTFKAVMGLMKSSDVYITAMSEVRQSEKVAQELGHPIEEGFFMTGNINISGSSGYANLQIPVSGPKGKGYVYLEAQKLQGRWHYNMLKVDVKESDYVIDLLAE